MKENSSFSGAARVTWTEEGRVRKGNVLFVEGGVAIVSDRQGRAFIPKSQLRSTPGDAYLRPFTVDVRYKKPPR